MSARKLIVASARLPVALKRTHGTGWTASASPGGLATALRSVAAQRPFTWIGWPGAVVPEDERDQAAAALEEHGVPVFLDEEENEGFYEEFSNRFLWPQFHALPTPVRFDWNAWDTYTRVNRRFAETIASQAQAGDTVWVHDYQLALVPGMLRVLRRNLLIGFFLHIPFPASESFRTLPVREAILQGMLGANFIGFHAYEYVSHFRNSALRILGLESEPESVLMPTHHASLGVLPIGIEPSEVREHARRADVAEKFEVLSEEYRGKTVILGVDRLDYTKGIPQKLLAMEELLRDNPDLRDKIVFLQVASPSRTGVAEYQSLKREIDELVGRVNGQFGTLESTPVVYINQHVPRAQLAALYKLADIMLVTPVRDGMNLVCLEYIAARGENPGTLILSEFAGAATCLSGAELVNPHNPSQIAAALKRSIDGVPSKTAFDNMRDFVDHNTSTVWAERNLQRLESIEHTSHALAQHLTITGSTLEDEARASRSRLVLLDYDGTLQPHARIPSEARPSQRVLDILTQLSTLAHVYVISGRDAEVLDDWLGPIGIGLVCEHGLAIKHPGETWSDPPVAPRSRVLDEVVTPLFREFVERTPGARLEVKQSSVVWHYRGSDPKLGAWRAKELRALLDSQLAGHPFAVLPGSKVIEVRHAQISKGNAVAHLLKRYAAADYIFCAGNDRTDEDMFEALEASGREPRLVCFVGSVHSSADYYVDSPSELLDHLEVLSRLWSPGG